MMSLFSGSQVSHQTSDAASMVPLSVVRQVIQEVADARANNLAFRESVVQHEAANAPAVAVMAPLAPKLRLGRGGGGGGGGGNSMQPVNRADLRIKPPNRNIPRGIPRRIPNQVVWDTLKYDIIIGVPTSGIQETNFTFSLVQHPQNGSWIALYDQWCVPLASITFRSEMPPGATYTSSTLYTALDFDGLGNLGSIGAIEDFGTCAVAEMSPGKQTTRSVKPCVKVSTQQPSTNVNSTVTREWQDSGAAGTPWFGIRSIVSASPTSYNIKATVTTYFAFRNQI